MTRHDIDDSEVLSRFNSYLAESNIQNAVELVFDDCIIEDLSEDEIEYVVEGILIPELVCEFARKFDALDNCYDGNPDPNSVFQTFCEFEHLHEDLANTLADIINKAVEKDHEHSDDNDEDSVFADKDWKELSAAERQLKVKAFLKKLSRSGLDAAKLRPFIKSLDVGEDPYGNDFRDATKPFDRAPHYFGYSPNEGTILFPNTSGQGHDVGHELHPLHKIALKYGYKYSHTTPVTQHDGSIFHHHSWVRGEHKIGAYDHDTAWSSKVSSSSGHVWTGIGTVALDKHLKNKAKRYKLPNTQLLPNTKIMESLLDPASQERVQLYADWMKRNPAKAFGVEGSYAVDSPANDLIEAAKLKAKAEKTFAQGKDVSDWSIFDFRSGKPR